MFRTVSCLRRVKVTIPRLSPTHTEARIYEWLAKDGDEMECYDPIFILECSPDVISEGYRQSKDHKPLMIVEAHDEGVLRISQPQTDEDTWHKIGDLLGTIDDDEGGVQVQGDQPHSASSASQQGNANNVIAQNDDEWLWQAYSHTEPPAS